MFEIEDYGNCVKIGDKLIPAVNIQVENMPGYLSSPLASGEKLVWYGIHFEIMFENGSLWEVSQWLEEKDADEIIIFEYSHWASGDRDEPTYLKLLRSWEDFVMWYELFLSCDDLARESFFAD